MSDGQADDTEPNADVTLQQGTATSVDSIAVDSNKVDKLTQTDLSTHLLSALEEECSALRKEKLELCKTVEDLQMSVESDCKKLTYYTGLDSVGALKALFNFISPHIKEHHLSSLSKFNQFLMILMKLRHNFTDQDLGYRFGVSQSTVSKN